jgi:hypothetical protein
MRPGSLEPPAELCCAYAQDRRGFVFRELLEVTEEEHGALLHLEISYHRLDQCPFPDGADCPWRKG